jgi:hypothetical protein
MKDPQEIVRHLSPDDALAILRILVRDNAPLAARIAEIATSYLSEVDPEQVAADLYGKLDMLEVEEVWDRAGPTRHGYVETGEAAEEMIDEVVDPLLQEMLKYHALGMRAQENRMCRGLLLGLYLFEHESKTEFKDWAIGTAAEFSSEVLDRWKEGSPSQEDVQAIRRFIDDELDGWVREWV